MKNWSIIIRFCLILGISFLAACGQDFNSNPSESGPRDFSNPDTFSHHKIQNPVFFTGTKEIQMEQREIPKEAEESRPDLKQAPIPVSFKNLILQIDLDQKKMNLKFTAVHGKGEEAIELEGPFDSSQQEWYAFLYSTDPAVRAEKRVRASAGCTDINVCDEIALDLTYEFEGEEYTRQFVKQLDKAISKPVEITSKLRTSPPVKKNLRFNQVSGAKQSRTTPAAPQQEEPVEEEPVEESAEESAEETEEETEEGIEESPKQESAKKDTSVPLKPKRSLNPKIPDEPQKPVVPKKKVVEDKSPKARPAVVSKKTEIGDGADYSGPVRLPRAPKEVTEPSQIPTLSVTLNQQTRQAIGRHTSGRLMNASLLPEEGPGYFVRSNLKVIKEDLRPTWGADVLVQLITEATTEFKKLYPEGPRVQVGSLSKKSGRRLGGHVSHQNGLDVDIAFISTKGVQNSFWSAVGNRKSEFDLEKNWSLIKLLNNTKERYIISIFLDRRIKKELCLFAYKKGEYNSDPQSVEFRALRSIHHQAGHHDHYHVRLHCPATVGCQESLVTLPAGTGCESYIK